MLLKKPNFRYKAPRAFWHSLDQHIQNILFEGAYATDNDKIFLAVLVETKERIGLNLVKYKPQLSLGFTAAQALSFKIMFQLYWSGNDWLDNELRKLSDKVDQYYAV